MQETKILGCSLVELSMPKARIFSREPYVVGYFVTGDKEVRLKCNPIQKIKRGKPFTGEIELMQPTAVGPYVAGMIEVWESDGGARDVGARIDQALKLYGESEVARRVVDTAADALGVGAAKNLISRAAGYVAEALLGASDDLLLSMPFELLEDEIRAGNCFKMQNPRVELTIEVTRDRCRETGEGFRCVLDAGHDGPCDFIPF